MKQSKAIIVVENREALRAAASEIARFILLFFIAVITLFCESRANTGLSTTILS